MEKGQSKARSFLEANVNTLIGFIVTLLFSPIIYKIVGMSYTYQQLGWVTLLFTILSVIRGYVIRRFFNKKEEKKDKLLLNQIDGMRQLNEDFANQVAYYKNKASQWESHYRKGRTARAKLQTDYYTLSDKLGDLQDEYDFTVKVARDYINGTEARMKQQDASRDVLLDGAERSLKSLSDELDMCKHLHTTAISDLVEGADYHSGEEGDKKSIEFYTDNLPKDANNSKSNS